MRKRLLNGDMAFAYGALSSGIGLVTSYPGSPSSGTVEALIPRAAEQGFYVEWSSNEKVAVEMAIGASIAGRRALVCTKSVGLNAMIDPLMALNLTPVHGGLVILLGDDPGGYGSQNDQDSRPLATFLEMPLLEPASPAEAFNMMREAFHLSETYHSAVVIRETRSFTQLEGEVSCTDLHCQPSDLGINRETYRFVPVPSNAVEKHRQLHNTMVKLTGWSERSSYNTVTGTGARGIIGAGYAYGKILDILGSQCPPGIRLLKLGVLFPLPVKLVTEFLRNCQEVLVVEENEPFVQQQLKSIAQEAGITVPIHGKGSGFLEREGETFRWQIQRALETFVPDFTPANDYGKENEAEERPVKKSFCGNCRYDEVLDALTEAAEQLGQKPVLVADPGCLVTVASRLNAKYAMGSAVAVADGMSKAGCPERAVALFGDSAFFHTALPGICNAVHNGSNILMVVLDNGATTTSGGQPNPGVATDALGRPARALDMAGIARACGVKRIFCSSPDDQVPTLNEVFQQALISPDLTLVHVKIESDTQDR